MRPARLASPSSRDGGGPVCIAHGYRWPEVQLAVAVLRDAGIRADLLDTLTHHQMPQMGLALGGVRIVVPPSQMRAAHDLLAAQPLMIARPLGWRLGLIFLFLLWFSHVPPMMSGLFLRRLPDTAAQQG
ncbi:hypothetical protein [Paracoccus siganidrum]|uniref:hypothetical protein n=1 Tax=Paracoccus siganidrum TaxID=1276757 RepID=UPI000E757D02|nr:hypothetical protein [Paracoccus siganidrum]RMC38907.1 hypothetical protein C9E82_06110 [Paracoccus siganidrum]